MVLNPGLAEKLHSTISIIFLGGELGIIAIIIEATRLRMIARVLADMNITITMGGLD